MRGTAAEEKIGPARQETRGDPAFSQRPGAWAPKQAGVAPAERT